MSQLMMQLLLMKSQPLEELELNVIDDNLMA